ncbi:MAG: iron-containing redox enzyme family protein [Actinomycetota bacterium]
MPALPEFEFEDAHLSLYLCYELHYRGLPGVDDTWEWEPSLLELRRSLEAWFLSGLLADLGGPVLHGAPSKRAVEEQLLSMATENADPGRNLARFLEYEATAAQFREFVIHRSLYHLKEADPHSWAIPRLTGSAKAALMEIQTDEYGSGSAERMHSALFAKSMRALGLDDTYGRYLDLVPGSTLATVNLMSMLGLQRRWSAAIAGHLALFEMSSSVPNRRYAAGLRRLGYGPDATDFFDEHVIADSAHELIAMTDLMGPLVAQGLGDKVLFGARSLDWVETKASEHILKRWRSGQSALTARPGLVAAG